jgi:hypothetical protein
MADSSYPPRDILELEKLREELLTELSRRHNWAAQEAFWQRQMSNWESQERHWVWQNRILLCTFILGVLGIVSRVFWP